MSKTTSVFVRMDPNTKQKAEEILKQLGLSASVAINMFYRQIIINNGLPFEVKCVDKEKQINDIIVEVSKDDMDIAKEIVEELNLEMR